MRKPDDSGRRNGTWLPLAVLRPFGPASSPYDRLEASILSTLGDPDEMPMPEMEDWSEAGAGIVADAEGLARISSMLEASLVDADEKDAASAALTLAARDPARHVVIASHSDDDVGLAVLGRSIEYVAGSNGLPIAVRYVTEILAACRPARPEVASAIANSAVQQVTFGLFNLCARASRVSVSLDGALSAAGVIEGSGDDPFVLPVEVHLRTTPGTDAHFATLMAELLGSFEAFIQLVNSDEFDQLTIRSPYLPGSLFTRDDRSGGGDTAAHLRGRELLRRSSLAGRSVAATHGELVLDDHGDDHYHAREVEASRLPLYDVLMDPAEPRISDVLDVAQTNPRIGLVEMRPCSRRQDMVLIELERTLSVEFDGDEAIVLLDVSLPALVGPYDRDGMAFAIAEVMMIQAYADLESIHVDLFDRVRRFKVRFSAPVAVASAIREEIGRLHEMLDGMPANFELARTIVVNRSLRKAAPTRAWSPMPLLASPVDVDPDDVLESASVALERLEIDEEIQQIEVLTRFPDGPCYMDLEDLEITTRDPFLVVRILLDEVAIPVVISTLTGRVFEGDVDLFWTAFQRLRLQPVERSAGTPGPDRVRSVAERMFTHTSIEVSYLPYLTPADDIWHLFGNDAAALAKYGEDIEAHLALLGDDTGRPRDQVGDFMRHSPPSANFHAAVTDDLRTPLLESIRAAGAPAVVAAFLTQGVVNLIGDEEHLDFEHPDPDFVFLFAYAYVRECLPDAVSATELAAVVGMVSLGNPNPAHPAEIGLVQTTTADIVGYVAREIGSRAQAPLYLATARIAAAFRAMSEEHDYFGLVL